MYGEGFGPEGLDRCNAGDGTATSPVYRIDTKSLAVDKVVRSVRSRKYVAVTPDGSKVLVSNWCSWTLSVIDTGTNTETTQIDLGGKYPRGSSSHPTPPRRMSRSWVPGASSPSISPPRPSPRSPSRAAVRGIS